MTLDLLRDLAHVKAIFQLRAIEAAFDPDPYGINASLIERKKLRESGYARPYRKER